MFWNDQYVTAAIQETRARSLQILFFPKTGNFGLDDTDQESICPERSRSLRTGSDLLSDLSDVVKLLSI